MMIVRCALFLLATALVPVGIAAEVRLPQVLSDHAVLQRERPIHIWGTASPSEKVTVQFHAQSVSGLADSWGTWEVWLLSEPAGGPYTLTITGSNSSKRVQRTDILVGDVWVASGQSNMEIPLTGFKGAPINNSVQEIAAANQPKLRLLRQKKRTSAVPLNDTDDAWTLCTPDTAKDFSAIAYFFGRKLSQEENVPVGLIDTTWGGSPVQSWISPDGISYFNLVSIDSDQARYAHDQSRADEIRAALNAEDDALRAAGKPVPNRGRIPNDYGASWTNGSWTPGTLFNAMVAPYTRYTIKGVLWYQGEADVLYDRAPHYARAFSSLIQDWRRQWAEGAIPFLFVQLSSFGNDPHWGIVRDAQRRALELLNTGMAVSFDVGSATNIHPPDKQTVADRLAQSALGMVYRKDIEFSSPQFVEATTEGNAIRVWFSHADGLTSRGKPLTSFEVAGEDGKFVPGTATIEGKTILAKSSSVPAPKYVRYGWAGTVTSFFYNSSGLPAGTFTSER